MKKIYIILIAALILAPVYWPIHKYRTTFNPNILSASNADWGTFGDYIGGVLNPYISLLTLLATIYIAYILYTYESKRDQQSQEEASARYELNKKEADVKSFMELYQFFISNEFREARAIAWDILKKAISNATYKDFIITENFVSRYVDRKPRADVYSEFRDMLYPKDHTHALKSENEHFFLKQEASDRNKIDVLVNFFQLLSIKNVPDDYYRICDFYYDTWRPVLYWYGTELDKAYNSLGDNRKFNNPPTLLEALNKLDRKFYKPDTLTELSKAGFMSHPIIIHMQSKLP
jgi:hypothetical protein